MPFMNTKVPKGFSVRVQTMDAELEFSLEHKATGRDLFDLVCRTIGLREIWYFGLQFVNRDGYYVWLKMEKKVLDQGLKKSEAPYQFLFLAKFFPEEVTEELIQDVTQHLFFLQVKQSILNMDIYCPPEASVLLASYAVQAKYGDYEAASYKPGMLTLEDLLPQRVIDQYQMTADMWEERIKTWWENNKGIAREEAELEYLRIAQDLDMYSVSYFPIRNKKKTDLWLGVTPLGLNIFTKDNKLAPTMSFLWHEIKNISFKDKKFIIRTNSKEANSKDFTFFSENLHVNKLILDLSVGNHNLWLKRRQADSMEVQQMKAQAKEERLRRQIDKVKFEREQNARLQLEREKTRLQSELAHLQEQFRAAQDALRRSEETSDLLAEKARISEEEALVLAKKASEAEAEIQRIKICAIKTEEQKIAMERKTREAELIAARVVQEADRKEKETDKLKDDLRKAQHAEKLAKERLMELTGTSFTVLPPVSPYNGYASDVRSSRSYSHFSGLGDHRDFDVSMGFGQERDIQTISSEIEKERLEYIQKSKYLQEQLSDLRHEIEGLKVDDRQTDFDRIYEENLQHGENKYSTLRKSAAGSARAKIALFDGL